MVSESRSNAGHKWKARTVTLGPAGYRPILWRAFLPNAILLLATVGAAVYYRNWGWLGIGGSVIAIYGVCLMSRRLLRLGLSRVDDDAPPHTWPDGQLNLDRLSEDHQRAVDNWNAAIGLALVVFGTLIAGALPFALNLLAPFR